MSATRLENDPALGLVHLTSVIANQSALPTKIGNETIGAAGASVHGAAIKAKRA